MPSYENMWTTLMIMLFFINGMFVFMASLPGSPLNDSRILLGLTSEQVDTINNQLKGIYQDTNVIQGDIGNTDDIVSASDSTKNYLTLFQTWLFGAANTVSFGVLGSAIQGLSLLANILSIGASMFFGYLLWINLFFPLGTPLEILGTIFKATLFFIQGLGIFDLIFRVFLGGTGTR
jgi:hypothetical protein